MYASAMMGTTQELMTEMRFAPPKMTSAESTVSTTPMTTAAPFVA